MELIQTAVLPSQATRSPLLRSDKEDRTMMKVVLWANTTNRTAPKLTNGGASISPNPSAHRPRNAENLEDWFEAGWGIDSVGGFSQRRDVTGHVEEEITVLVLRHE